MDRETETVRQVASKDNHLYKFGLKNAIIDAQYLGSTARFMNHDNNLMENVRAEVWETVNKD